MKHQEKFEVAELICLKCLNRWIGKYPLCCSLKDIECRCGEVGYIIKTGQTLSDIDVEKFKHDWFFRPL